MSASDDLNLESERLDAEQRERRFRERIVEAAAGPIPLHLLTDAAAVAASLTSIRWRYRRRRRRR